jgi:hypothetical protein
MTEEMGSLPSQCGKRPTTVWCMWNNDPLSGSLAMLHHSLPIHSVCQENVYYDDPLSPPHPTDLIPLHLGACKIKKTWAWEARTPKDSQWNISGSQLHSARPSRLRGGATQSHFPLFPAPFTCGRMQDTANSSRRFQVPHRCWFSALLIFSVPLPIHCLSGSMTDNYHERR